jgi:uncharacterized lipoprotein YddW (UPF0748 family)
MQESLPRARSGCRRSWLLPAVVALALGLVNGACSDGTRPVGPLEPPDIEVPSPPQEARALWISRWDWLDQAQLKALIDNAAAANFNIIYMQVRGRADAYYRSSLEPWAHRPPAFVLGQDPGWDPLAVAIQAAAAHGLQVHAWINALVGWCTRDSIPETSPRHILLAHPEWRMVSESGEDYVDGCTWITPGDAAARAHLGAVAADIVRSYPVHGVHLDYIRYPNNTYSWDAQSRDAYDAARTSEPALGYDEFRRRLVTAAVKTVQDSMRTARPAAVLSAAVWGVYRNTAGWSGIATGYDARLQDSWRWAADGVVDAVVPMIYWNIKSYGERLDFAWLADDFARGVRNRHLYVGMGVFAPSVDPTFCVGCDVVAQVYRARTAGGHGVSVYSGQLMRGAGLWNALATGPFRTRVPVPPMPWK